MPESVATSVEEPCFGGRRRWLSDWSGEVGRALIDLDDAFESIGVDGGLVPPDSLDPREAQGISALVAIALLDLIAGNLQHNPRLDQMNVASLADRNRKEQLGELGDFGIRESAVSFADVDEPGIGK
jgi:hypothetical protein